MREKRLPVHAVSFTNRLRRAEPLTPHLHVLLGAHFKVG